MSNHISKTQKSLLRLCLYLSLPILLITTNPNRLPLPLIILPLLLLFLIIYDLSLKIVRRMQPALEKKKRVAASVLIATLPTLLVIFQSIQQLSIWDILLTVGLLAGFSLYLSKADFLA